MVVGFCSVVVWMTPTRSSGRIIGYDVMFVDSQSGSVLTVSKGVRELFHTIEGTAGLVTTDNTFVQVSVKATSN